MGILAREAPEHQIRSRILQSRPYHPWWLMPLAEFLTTSGYGDSARNRIVDSVDDGMLLDSLVVDGSLEPVDLPGAEAALESGRRWRSSRTLSVEPFMPDDEPYIPTDDDLRDYGEWSESLDYRDAVREHAMALQTFLTLFPE